MKRVVCAVALGAVLLAQSSAGAFGEAGHRVVGLLAERHLAGTRALKEVRTILRPQESLADAAVWPDRIKNITYEDGDTGPFRLEHPGQDIYHYTNIAFSANRYDEHAPGAHWLDIVRIMRESMRVLQGRSNVFSRREALRMLAHLVGDIHQPLHVGTSYVANDMPLRFVEPKGPTGWRPTLGGNALRYGPNDNFSLHSYWDSHIVNLAMRKDTPDTFAARLAKEIGVQTAWRTPGDPDGWPAAWATEVLALAREAHTGIRLIAPLEPDRDRGLGHRWRIQQPAGYDDMARERVRVQLAKGGYRLAAVLQAIWP